MADTVGELAELWVGGDDVTVEMSNSVCRRLSLKPIASVPKETARVARAAFPKGNAVLRLRDELVPIYHDDMFAAMYPTRGQPAAASWHLAMISILQFLESLPDRQAAEIVRGRINWKYTLTRIRGFSGCGLETIAGLKVALGFERVDLVGGNGRDDVNEGVDDGSMPGQIEGGELLDMADDGLGHVPRLEQGFIFER
jgi:hypothetical protein